jgi:predicted Holliday junction resolvase-like endonuclease
MKRLIPIFTGIALVLSGCTQAVETGQEIQQRAQDIRTETEKAVQSAQESVAGAADEAWATKERIEEKTEQAQEALDAINRLTEE